MVLKRLQRFAEEFKKDFECIQLDLNKTKPQQYAITLDAFKNIQGSSGCSTDVRSALTTATTSISNPVNVGRLQPISELLSPPLLCFVWVHEDGWHNLNILVEVHAQEVPASVTAHNLNISVEVHAQESSASVTTASSSTCHVSFISQTSALASNDDAVESCTTVCVSTFSYRYRFWLC